MKKLITIIAFLLPISSYALGLIENFEWLEPNNSVEIVIGEPYQLKFSCSDNSLVFTSDYANNWVHVDFDGGQHIVEQPIGYSIGENGIITGLAAGSYAMHPTGWIQRKDGVDKWLYITVVSEKKEIESNNTFDTSNDITSKIRFGLFNTSDIDYFKYTSNILSSGDVVTFKIHYDGPNENPYGYKWATFCGVDMVAGGSLLSQDQECNALVTSDNTVYLEVYFDESLSQYFNYDEEFVAEVYINGVPASEITTPAPEPQEPVDDQDESQEFIDLALPSGNLWAKTNIGARHEYEHGDKYAFGEIITKDQYMEYNYTWLNYDTNEFTKYVSTGQYADNKTVLDPEDDIVTHLYGEGFKIPSQSDYQELFDNCSTVWEEKNGTWGLSFIGNNGYSIFLPASGFTYSYNQYLNDIGYYMTSGVAADDYIWLLYFSTSETSTYWMNVRHQGYAVRGIKCGNLSGLNDIIKNQSTVESYYNLQGIKKVFPSKGLNIIKTKDGKTKKIIVK